MSTVSAKSPLPMVSADSALSAVLLTLCRETTASRSMGTAAAGAARASELEAKIPRANADMNAARRRDGVGTKAKDGNELTGRTGWGRGGVGRTGSG